MEITGITLSAAGSTAVNGTYLCDDATKTGYARTWSNVNAEVSLYYNGTMWEIADTTHTTKYYVCQQLDPTVPVKDPWSTAGAWINDATCSGLSPAPIVTTFRNPNIIIEVGDPIIEYDEETGDKITTVVTTYTDTSTGNVRRESNVTREKNIYKTINLEDRTITPKIYVNKIYRFSFIREFKTLGYIPTNSSVDATESNDETSATGIFRVTRMLSYMDLITMGIDLYENLYSPLNLPREMFEEDQQAIYEGCIYELTDPSNLDHILYMPLCFIDGTPDSSVEEYNRIMYLIDLGYFSDMSLVAELTDLIRDLLLCRFGMDETENVNPSELIRGDSYWMHVQDYELLDKRREQIKASIKSKSAYTDLMNKLFNSDMNKLRSLNLKLTAQNEALEEIIINEKQVKP